MSSNEVFTRQNVTCSVVHGKYVKLGILLKSVKNVIFTNWNGCYWYSKPKCFAISHESIVDFFFFKVRNDWISASISCSIWNLSNWICIEVEFECLRLSFWCVWSSRRWCPLIINYNKNESSLINRWWSNILDRSLFLSTCVRVCVHVEVFHNGEFGNICMPTRRASSSTPTTWHTDELSTETK